MSRAAAGEVTSRGSHSDVRSRDRDQVEEMVEVLVSHQSSLLLCSDDDGLLDRQAQLLIHGLRRVERVETALLFEMDRELLLERFNRLLSDMTVQEARFGSPSVVRVWVFQLQSEVELAQARLLLRLSQDLPGSGVVLLLLAPEALAAELAPRGGGRRLQVRILSEPPAQTAPERRNEEPEGPSLASAQSVTAAPAMASTSSWKGANRGSVAVVGLVLFGLSVAGLLQLHSVDALPAWTSKLALPEGRSLTNTPSETPASMPEHGGRAEATSSARPIPGSEASLDAPSVPAVPGSAAPGIQAAAPLADGIISPIAGGNDLPLTTVGAAAIEEQTARTADWINAQPGTSWVVQHAVARRAGTLIDLRARQPVLAGARIAALTRNDGQVYFALVSGPFGSVADARAFEKDLPQLASPSWVRSVAGVKRELEASPKTVGLESQPPVR